jgi:hypothetical protein
MFENISLSRGPMYDPLAVQPMRDELTFVGFEELLTPQAVHDAVKDTEGTLFVLINSVCGCAAGSARPAATAALQHGVIPRPLRDCVRRSGARCRGRDARIFPGICAVVAMHGGAARR